MIFGTAVFVACGRRGEEGRASSSDSRAATAADECRAPEVRRVVEALGERLKLVSLQAPDSIVARSIREEYGPYVTTELRDAWLAAPKRAPGRQVSSPWPERIDVRSIARDGPGLCRAEGEIVYLTSVEAAQGGSAAASRDSVTIRVSRVSGEWKVSAFETHGTRVTDRTGPPAASAVGADSSTSAAAAADVVRRYYGAIEARDFRRAYEMWGNAGQASGKTLDAFTSGFRDTKSVDVDVGTPGRIDAAAGSRYVEVPVVVRAVTNDGRAQRFTGTYVLRRTVVEGSSAAAREWHIYSARIVSSVSSVSS